jgi:hypothetical protein
MPAQKQTSLLTAKEFFGQHVVKLFFGSLRMGELLSDNEYTFPMETLTWNCVSFTPDASVSIRIKFPKTCMAGKSQFVDLFKIGKHSFCPFNCLKGQ